MLIRSYVLRLTFYQLKGLVTKTFRNVCKEKLGTASLWKLNNIERTNKPILTWSLSGCSKINWWKPWFSEGLSNLAGRLLLVGRSWMGDRVCTAKFPMADLTSVRVGELTDGA